MNPKRPTAQAPQSEPPGGGKGVLRPAAGEASATRPAAGVASAARPAAGVASAARPAAGAASAARPAAGDGQPRPAKVGAAPVLTAAAASTCSAGADSLFPEDENDERLSAGEVVAGKYRLDRLIARGGMGSVWAGWDTGLDRAVAVKFMARAIASSKRLRERFHREAKAAAGLRTPFVVQIFEHGVHGRLPFIVMELLEGEDLHDRLKRERRLSPASTARILNQIARGLRRAHAKGLIHRDLKPRNIFLARDDDEESVKILDFGIAKNLQDEPDGDTTKTGQVLGSLNYMSPEQARGLRDIDHRSDLWAIAVILFRCLTGRTLFSGESSGDVIVKICTEDVPKITDVAPDLPESFNEVFSKALSRDPQHRYPTATDLAQAFTDAIRMSRSVRGGAVAAAVGSESGPQSGSWTPGEDLGTPLSDIQSYPSVDYGLSGPGALTPPPARSDPGSGSAPSRSGDPFASTGPSSGSGPSTDSRSGPTDGSSPSLGSSSPSASLSAGEFGAPYDAAVASRLAPSLPENVNGVSTAGGLDDDLVIPKRRTRLWLGAVVALTAALLIVGAALSWQSPTEGAVGASSATGEGTTEPASPAAGGAAAATGTGPAASGTSSEGGASGNGAAAGGAAPDEPPAVATTSKPATKPPRTPPRTTRPAPKPTATQTPAPSTKNRWGY